MQTLIIIRLNIALDNLLGSSRSPEGDPDAFGF
jgi:hypothetical protein